MSDKIQDLANEILDEQELILAGHLTTLLYTNLNEHPDNSFNPKSQRVLLTTHLRHEFGIGDGYLQ